MPCSGVNLSPLCPRMDCLRHIVCVYRTDSVQQTNDTWQEMQRILSRCLDFLHSSTETASGLHEHCDYMLIIKAFEAQILTWRQQSVLRPVDGWMFLLICSHVANSALQVCQPPKPNTLSSYPRSIFITGCLRSILSVFKTHWTILLRTLPTSLSAAIPRQPLVPPLCVMSCRLEVT